MFKFVALLSLLILLSACSTAPQTAQQPASSAAVPTKPPIAPSPADDPTPEPTPAPSPTRDPNTLGDSDMPTPDFSQVPELPTPLPPQTLAVGETATLPDGQTITLHAVERTDDIRSFGVGNPGDAGLSFDVEWCAGPQPNGGQVQTSAVLAFDTVLEDNTRGGGALIGIKEPSFVNATIAANECNRGWVSLGVPGDKRVQMITFETRTAGSFDPVVVRWELP